MTHDDMPEVLKPCPFCGNDNIDITVLVAYAGENTAHKSCRKCGGKAPIDVWDAPRVTPPEVDLDKLREAFVITADSYAVDNLDKLEKWNEALRLIRQAAAAYLKERG